MQNVQENSHSGDTKISRRSLMASAAAAAAVTISAGTSTARAASPTKKFKLKYAPNFGMFKEHAGNDPIDQIKFMADQGFTAIFDNGLMRKPQDLVAKIVKELDRRDMALGPFVLQGIGGKSFVANDKGYKGVLCMEHGRSKRGKEGEKAVIEAYRACDDF